MHRFEGGLCGNVEVAVARIAYRRVCCARYSYLIVSSCSLRRRYSPAVGTIIRCT